MHIPMGAGVFPTLSYRVSAGSITGRQCHSCVASVSACNILGMLLVHVAGGWQKNYMQPSGYLRQLCVASLSPPYRSLHAWL